MTQLLEVNEFFRVTGTRQDVEADILKWVKRFMIKFPWASEAGRLGTRPVNLVFWRLGSHRSPLSFVLGNSTLFIRNVVKREHISQLKIPPRLTLSLIDYLVPRHWANIPKSSVPLGHRQFDKNIWGAHQIFAGSRSLKRKLHFKAHLTQWEETFCFGFPWAHLS